MYVGDHTLTLLRQLRIEQSQKCLSTYVFTKETSPEPMHPQSPTRYLKKFSEQYGIPDLHPHKLRHTFACAQRFGGVQGSNKLRSMLFTLLGGGIALYGVAALVRRGLPVYLFAQAEFVFLDYGESKILFYLDYLAMMGTFIFLAHYAAKLLKSAKKNQQP